jgi:hypothetical protein
VLFELEKIQKQKNQNKKKKFEKKNIQKKNSDFIRLVILQSYFAATL